MTNPFAPSRPPEDISGEGAIRGCGTVEFAGAARPRLGQIALLGKLGSGGMGVVYHGVHMRLEEEVAVKVLARMDLDRTPDLAERFLREARYARRLDSPNVVRVLDADEDAGSGCHFIVMEYVPGVSASAWAGTRSGDRAGVSEEQALDVCIAACRGLAAAHDAGIVHRDVKPENLLVPADADGTLRPQDAKLADLGLARADSGDASLTGTHLAMGTPGYMAPEQISGAKGVGAAADVFAMGATLFSLLTGASPFAGSTPADTLVRTAVGKCQPIGALRTDVSGPTAAVIAICLRSNPADRFPDGGALMEALVAARRGEFADPGPPSVPGRASARTEDLVGKVVSECRLEELIDAGARTSVYRATDSNLHQTVAVRILHPDAAEDAEVTDRFIHAHVGFGQLVDHPGINTMHKIGRDEGLELIFAIYEFVDGESLETRVSREGPMDAAAVLSMLREGCAAAASAHGKRLVFGRISPRTLMLDSEGCVRLVGYGRFQRYAGRDTGLEFSDPRYAAPECLERKQADWRVDIYGLGVTAFYALAGRPPFDVPTGADVLVAALSAETPHLRDYAPDVPADLADLVHRMMSRNPNDRIKTAENVLEALNAIL